MAAQEVEFLPDESNEELMEAREAHISKPGLFPRKVGLALVAVGIVSVSASILRQHIFGGLVPPVKSDVQGTTQLNMATLTSAEYDQLQACLTDQLDILGNMSIPGTGLVLSQRCTVAFNNHRELCPNMCPGVAIHGWTASAQVICGGDGSLCCLGKKGSTVCAAGGVCCVNSNYEAYCCAAGNQCKDNVCVAPDGQCFPGEAMVQVRDRGEVELSSLRQGEHVLVSKSMNKLAYEPVISFLHSIPARGQADSIVKVVHSRGQLRVSPNHLVFIRSGNSHVDKLASDLREGDELLFASSVEMGVPYFSRVLSIHDGILNSGMYAPLTPCGNIIVDNVVVSNYASYSSSAWVPHSLFHVLFAPLRAFHALGLGGKVSHSDVEELHPYVEWLAAVHGYVQSSGVSTQWR